MPLIDFQLVKEMISMSDVLKVIGWRPCRYELAGERGPCPVHGSRSPASRSFSVSPQGFYCHSCKEHGDQLRLYCLVNRVSTYVAAQELCERLGIRIPYLYTPDQRRPGPGRNSEEAR